MLPLNQDRQSLGLGGLALFASLGTLLCCALPIVLVALGLGSVFAAITLDAPFLVTLAAHHNWMFALSAVLLVLSTWRLSRISECPADPEVAASCAKVKIWTRRVLWLAALIWLTGVFFAYLLLPLRQWLFN